MTCDGSSLPLEHAEPVDTANPSLSSFTTQRCWPSAFGISAETVFHNRGWRKPTTSASGKASSKRSMNASRHLRRRWMASTARQDPGLAEVETHPCPLPGGELAARVREPLPSWEGPGGG